MLKIHTTARRKRNHRNLPLRAMRGAPQRGMMMIESLVSIVIIMLGILGIAGLTAKSAAWARQAQYRTEAGMYAAQIVQMISLKVDRSTPDTLRNSLQDFEHNATNGSESCNFSGGAKGSDSDFEGVLKAARGAKEHVLGLPGATEQMQQVRVDTSAGNDNQVTVTLCWQGPNDAAVRNYELQAYVH